MSPSQPKRTYKSQPRFYAKLGCPICSFSKTIPVFRPLPKTVFFENKFFAFSQHHCPRCHRVLQLQVVYDHHKRIIFDAYQWIRQEISRLKHLT